MFIANEYPPYTVYVLQNSASQFYIGISEDVLNTADAAQRRHLQMDTGQRTLETRLAKFRAEPQRSPKAGVPTQKTKGGKGLYQLDTITTTSGSYPATAGS